VRPHCEALLVPRLFITRDGWLSGRGLMETCFGQAQAFFNGRAEPAPPRGGNFAEGCALRVRRDRSPRTPGHGFSDIESLAPATGANIFLDPEAGLRYI
jgi:hypothetical protein